MSIRFRSGTNEDIPAMIKAGDTLFDFPIKEKRALEFIEDPRHHIELAYSNENLVGFASCFIYVHPDKDPIMFINEVSVLKEFRNQGISAHLVSRLNELAKDLNCKESWLATEVDNLPARKSYQNAGGKEEDEKAVVYVFDLKEKNE